MKKSAKRKPTKKKAVKQKAPFKYVAKEIDPKEKELDKIILRMDDCQRGVYFSDDVMAQEIAGCKYEELVRTAKEGSRKAFLNLVTINTELKDGEIKVWDIFREEDYVKNWWEKCSWHLIHKAMVRRVNLDYPHKNVKRKLLRYIVNNAALWKSKGYTYNDVNELISKEELLKDAYDVQNLIKFLNRHGYKLGKRKRT